MERKSERNKNRVRVKGDVNRRTEKTIETVKGFVGTCHKHDVSVHALSFEMPVPWQPYKFYSDISNNTQMTLDALKNNNNKKHRKRWRERARERDHRTALVTCVYVYVRI